MSTGLRESEVRRVRKLRYALYALLLCAFLALAFFFGRASAPEKYENCLTFYATITRRPDEDSFLVSGLDENGVNFRSEFVFTVDSDTLLAWQGGKISLKDFQVGDTVSITFTGGVRESYPGRLVEVLRLELLDDEK